MLKMHASARAKCSAPSLAAKRGFGQQRPRERVRPKCSAGPPRRKAAAGATPLARKAGAIQRATSLEQLARRSIAALLAKSAPRKHHRLAAARGGGICSAPGICTSPSAPNDGTPGRRRAAPQPSPHRQAASAPPRRSCARGGRGHPACLGAGTAVPCKRAPRPNSPRRPSLWGRPCPKNPRCCNPTCCYCRQEWRRPNAAAARSPAHPRLSSQPPSSPVPKPCAPDT
mmetsp:Transcript_20923/g.62616  ORF Transcript_20923/g.62616 Transcript_20923/m.62616 type:complete len:228 (+) Transcript_20923:256-939(+)